MTERRYYVVSLPSPPTSKLSGQPGRDILERSLKIILANPEQVKALRGKKTDPNDSRMASLLRHGLVQGSFIHETFVNCGI